MCKSFVSRYKEYKPGCGTSYIPYGILKRKARKVNFFGLVKFYWDTSCRRCEGSALWYVLHYPVMSHSLDNTCDVSLCDLPYIDISFLLLQLCVNSRRLTVFSWS